MSLLVSFFFLQETHTNFRIKLEAELINNVDSVVAKSHFESVKSFISYLSLQGVHFYLFVLQKKMQRGGTAFQMAHDEMLCALRGQARVRKQELQDMNWPYIKETAIVSCSFSCAFSEPSLTIMACCGKWL